MPSSTQILEALTAIANGAVSYAIAFHVLLAVCFISWGAGLGLPRRAAVVLAVAPLASVAVFAGLYGVLFNALMFALLTLASLSTGLRSACSWRAAVNTPLALLGGVLLGFGWVYPHFLNNAHALMYLYASPLGLLPCPTLAFLIGLSLSAGVPGGRVSARILALAGLFYGAWGVLKLGVWVDGILLVGALGLLFATRGPARAGQAQAGTAALHASP
jgi:hypothetical protein